MATSKEKKTLSRERKQTMIRKYEIDIIQIRRCLKDVCEELFSDMIVANRIYERIDDAVEDFLDDNILEEEADNE